MYMGVGRILVRGITFGGRPRGGGVQGPRPPDAREILKINKKFRKKIAKNALF